MPDEALDVVGIKKTCVAHAQKISVLWPLIGQRSLHDDDVILGIQVLQRRWRKRLELLRDKGWQDLQGTGKLQFARNCPPQIVVAVNTKTLRPCKMNNICPWCYMRQVADLFNVFATYLPERGALKKTGINLLEISGKMLLRRNEAGKYLSGHFMEWQTVPKKLLQRLKPLGAYRSISLDPKVVEGQFSAWRFSYHILALMVNGWEVPTWLNNGRRKVRLTYVQSKKQLVNVVGRTARYPVGLIRGDPHMTIVSLNARRKKRCCEVTGCLRGGSNDSNSRGGEETGSQVAEERRE